MKSLKQFLKQLEYRNLVLLVIGTFLLKLILYPWAQVIDADAVTRIFLARGWWENPELITEGVWLPFHQYLFGCIVGITNDLINAPIIFNLFLSSITAIPLFHFTKREFNSKAALWVALAFSLNPVIFHNSYHTLAGTPFLLLTALGLNAFSKGLAHNNIRYFMYAGIFMTLASGFRYEAWIVIAIFTLIGLVQKQWRGTFWFWIIAISFPLIWMLGNYSAHGQPLYGVPGVYNSEVVLEAEKHVPHDYVLLRLFFFPVSWFFLFSPILVFGIIYTTIRRIRRKNLVWSQLRWAIPFVLLLISFIYKSHQGTLLTQHRFSSVLILFSVPFIAWLWEEKRSIQFVAISGVLLLLPLSYIWTQIPYEKAFSTNSSSYFAVQNFRKISNATGTPVPRLKNQNTVFVGNRIAAERLSKEGLIIEYSSWQDAYYLILRSEITSGAFHVVGKDKLSPAESKELLQKLNKYPTGIWVQYKGVKEYVLDTTEGNLTLNKLPSGQIKLTLLDDFKEFGIYHYHYSPKN